MKLGRTRSAVLVNGNIAKDKVKPLDQLIDEEGWNVKRRKDGSLHFEKTAGNGGIANGTYFPLRYHRKYATEIERLNGVLNLSNADNESLLKGSTHAIVFPSDDYIIQMPFCFTSMVFMQRASLTNKIKQQYGERYSVKIITEEPDNIGERGTYFQGRGDSFRLK